LADIAGIFGYNRLITDGVAEFCNNDDLFGHSVAPNKRELCIIHHTKILGGSRLNLEVTWFNLLGTGDTAIHIGIDSPVSPKQVSFLAPPWESLVTACASVAVLNTLAASAEDVEVKIHGAICLPPLLAEAEMNLASKTLADLAMAFVAAMVSHDGLMEAPSQGTK
jgi:hypothetical protein